MLNRTFAFSSLLRYHETKWNSTSCNISNFLKRGCSSQPQEKKFGLMDFPIIIWPNLLLSLRNLVYDKLLIKPFYDKDFSTKEFSIASKDVIVKVSNELSKGNFSYLTDLVEPKTLQEVKDGFAQLTFAQQQKLSLNLSDIFFCFPYQLGIIHSGEGESRVFAEITMCYHILHNFKFGVEYDPKEIEKDIFIANYRFIREITKGIEDQWTINVLNYISPHEHKFNLMKFK